MSKFLKRAKQLNIKAKTTVFSEYVGSHISKKRGEGYDFSEIKEYTYGDDIRHIDWTISAKLGQPHVKIFNEENKLFLQVVSLLNGSSYFGSKRLKQDLIAEIVAIILNSGVKKQDIVRSFIASQELEYESALIKRVSSVEKEIEEILSFDPLGKVVDLQKLSKDLSQRVKRKSLIFLVGDFLDGLSSNTLPNLSLLSKKHEVIAIVVRDRVEESLGEFSSASFIDPATKKSFFGNLAGSTKKRYKEAIKRYDKSLNAHFHKFKIKSVKIYTDEDPFKKLLKVFNG